MVTNIAIGPSAPPMIPMAPASDRLKPSTFARMSATKIPRCAPAPSRTSFGLAIIGPKSVMAPTPRKISGGTISSETPL